MTKRFTAMFITQACLITVLGIALNLNFCCVARASAKCPELSGPPGVKETPVVVKKCPEKQPDAKIKDARLVESPSIISKLLTFDLPKISFGDFALSAQKALLDKLLNDEPVATPPPPPPSGKTSQYIKNGVLRNN